MNILLFCLILAGSLTFVVEGAAVQPLYEDAAQIRELLKVLQQSIETSETLLNFIDYRASEIEESLEGTVDCHTKEEDEEDETDEVLDVVMTGEQPEWKTEKPTEMIADIHDKHVVFESEGATTEEDGELPTIRDVFTTPEIFVTTPILGEVGDDDRETLPPVPSPSGPGQTVQHCFIKGANDFSEMYNHAK